MRKITGESWGQPQGWCIGCLCSAVVKYQMNSGGFLKEDSIKGHRVPGGERVGSWPLVCRKLWLDQTIWGPLARREGGQGAPGRGESERELPCHRAEWWETSRSNSSKAPLQLGVLRSIANRPWEQFCRACKASELQMSTITCLFPVYLKQLDV